MITDDVIMGGLLFIFHVQLEIDSYLIVYLPCSKNLYLMLYN